MDPPPRYTREATLEPDRKREINKLRTKCRELQGDMFRRWQAWQGLNEDAVIKLLNRNETSADKEGRTREWYKKTELCSRSGGCCGRTCGCCDKPLDQFYARSGNCKELVHVYGHCTAECACCIKEHGIYKPDKRLGKPITKFDHGQ
ncbi:hypothetical protein BDW74DRAFT_54706 [Aspergillus multicolor]|uniref:uncharacterized protein n=1 Tax=Aspergillus multicolor TaxID=41759 RepID=UPI003CCC9585